LVKIKLAFFAAPETEQNPSRLFDKITRIGGASQGPNQAKEQAGENPETLISTKIASHKVQAETLNFRRGEQSLDATHCFRKSMSITVREGGGGVRTLHTRTGEGNNQSGNTKPQ